MTRQQNIEALEGLIADYDQDLPELTDDDAKGILNHTLELLKLDADRASMTLSAGLSILWATPARLSFS